MSSLANSTALIPAAGSASLENALGTDLLGTFCGLILYGLIVNQFYKYCRAYPSDSIFIRTLIVAVMLLETAQTAMTMHYTYFFLVTNFANPMSLAKGTWSVNINPLFAALVTIFSELFFVRRIYMIGLRFRIVAAVTAMLLFSEIPIAVYIIHGFISTSASVLQLKWFIGASLLIPTLVDTLLTSTLIIVLRRSRAGLKRNDGIVDLMVIYGLNTGALHWALNLSSFLPFVAVSNPFNSEIFGAFNIAAARVYAITFLSVLNSRETKSSVAIFDSGAYGLKAFERVGRRVAAETWNVPQIQGDDEPGAIHIRVTTELEGEPSWDVAKIPQNETSGSELDCAIEARHV